MSADTFAKNGQPCLKEICLGDDAFALGSVKWREAVSGGFPGVWDATSKPIRTLDPKRLSFDQVRNDLRTANETAFNKIAPYWSFGRLDKQGLQALRGVTAVCQAQERALPEASFLSESGHETYVYFRPVAAADAKSVKFVVTRIVRRFKGVETQAQGKELAEQIETRYWQFYIAKTPRPTPGQAIVTLNSALLDFSTFIGPNNVWLDSLKQLPACGGKRQGQDRVVRPT